MNADAICFVDTNLLIYARDASEKTKQPVALAWMQWLWETMQGRLSVQVLNEFYVASTQKLKPGLTKKEAWSDVEDLLTWRPSAVSQLTILGAREIQSDTNFSWWDSLILSSALELGCQYLLSEDLNPNQKYKGIEILNPFQIQLPS